MTRGLRFAAKAMSPQGGGAAVTIILLIAFLLLGLAAGFAARALTGQRRSDGRASVFGQPGSFARLAMPPGYDSCRQAGPPGVK